MFNNGNYYQQLLKYSLEVKCPSIIQIDLDLRRTFPEEERVMNENFQRSLRNVLMCYSLLFLLQGKFFLNLNQFELY